MRILAGVSQQKLKATKASKATSKVRASIPMPTRPVAAANLRRRVGRGYSTTNLRYFRTFYLAFREHTPEILHIGSGEFERDVSGKTTVLAPRTLVSLLTADGCRG